MAPYRVIDLQTHAINPHEIVVEARTPEAAAKEALGIDLVRSGAPRELRARVYFQHPANLCRWSGDIQSSGSVSPAMEYHERLVLA